MNRFLLIAALALPLAASDSKTALRKLDTERNRKFHQLAEKAKTAEAALSEFVTAFGADCTSRGMGLTQDPMGDLVCAPRTMPAPPQPSAPPPQPPPGPSKP